MPLQCRIHSIYFELFSILDRAIMCIHHPCLSLPPQTSRYVFSPRGDLGCQPCDCHVTGSLGPQCDPSTGVCPCRPGVTGRKCDVCMEGFAGMDSDGCKGIHNVCNKVNTMRATACHFNGVRIFIAQRISPRRAVLSGREMCTV